MGNNRTRGWQALNPNRIARSNGPNFVRRFAGSQLELGELGELAELAELAEQASANEESERANSFDSSRALAIEWPPSPGYKESSSFIWRADLFA